MTRRRRIAAVACIALVVAAAVLPLCGVALDWVVVPTAFVLLETLTPTSERVGALRCDALPIADLRPLDTRGPPSLSLA